MNKNAKQPNGAVIYRGPSLIDSSPIVVVAIGLNVSSKNRKTGNMIQTYILRDDINPIDAVKTGADKSICGNCVHRGDGTGKGRTCYVNLGQGALSVYKALQRGIYPVMNPTGLAMLRLVRLGTYGDPAAVPAHIWGQLLYGSTGHTGYTHQWKKTGALPASQIAFLRDYCMASADSESDSIDARLAGWRTFRVVIPGQVQKLEKESICPASAEGGKKLTCDKCLACNGNNTTRKGSIVIQAHGSSAVMANIRRMAA